VEFQGRLAFQSRLDFLVQPNLYIEAVEVETGAGLVGYTVEAAEAELVGYTVETAEAGLVGYTAEAAEAGLVGYTAEAAGAGLVG
jgi:hypothetical protein